MIGLVSIFFCSRYSASSCFVKGAGKLVYTVENHLNIKPGETTEDREYSLEVVRCIGACGLAPVMMVDEVTHGQVKASKMVKIIESYRDAPAEKPGT